MSRLRGVLDLDVTPQLARRSCEQVLEEMGWHVTNESPDTIEAWEDPARLPCHHSPAATKLQVAKRGDGCSVTIETKVPGFGSIASSHAQGRQNTIVSRLHAATTRPSPS